MTVVLWIFLTMVAMTICMRLIKIVFVMIKSAGDWLENLVRGKR